MYFLNCCYFFEGTIGFDVKASFARRPVSRLIKPGNITKELPEKAFQFHRTFHGLKFSNWIKYIYQLSTAHVGVALQWVQTLCWFRLNTFLLLPLFLRFLQTTYWTYLSWYLSPTDKLLNQELWNHFTQEVS